MRRASLRKQDASEQLVASVEAELGTLLDFLPTPLLVTSTRGRILRANRAALVFLDLTGPLVNRDVADVICAESVDVITTILRHERTVVRLCALQNHTT